ncbi:MAG: hypothetical protein EOO11_02695 [Chitinophagaceae bacterium]|nr:MAG: hypothetical protein EOO11_02695 [Chitinophagaceae bacterium]
MTRRLLSGLLLAALFLFVSSCKKNGDDDDTNYFVKVKKNGSWVEYPIVAGELGPDLADPSFTNLGVAAQTANGSERLDLTIQVSGTNLTTGTYVSGNGSYTADLDMTIQDGGSFDHYSISDDPNSSTPSVYTITITRITEDAITGRFTGNYLYDNFAGTSGATLQVTEGEFHVKRIR